jgi:hypothetical protein
MMIRDLTKSAISFSWAISLLSVKQAANVVQPGPNGGGNLFAVMAQVAADQLDESMKGIYRTGDNLQSSLVDMAFGWMNPDKWMNPGKSMGWAANAVQSAQPSSGCCGHGAQPTGQGPSSDSGFGMPR